MQNREPTYPGRVTMTPVFGQANTYDMERADQPLQQGTPLNKATLLKDATAALYGLGTGAVPDDVLAVLGRFQSGLGNEYIWEKKLTTVQKTYDLGTENPLYMCAYKGGGNQSTVMTVTYSDDIDISPGNVASLKAPIYTVDVTYNNYSAANVLKGKFFLAALDVGDGITTIVNQGIIVKGSENGEASKRFSTSVYTGVYFPAKPVENVQYTAIDQITYVNSPNANAYPPAVPDGYTYTPLGQLGDQVRIETGSYVGTGAYGASSPNTLTFGFVPKLVIVCKKNGFLTPSDGGYNQSFLWVARQFVLSIYAVNSISFVSISANGNTLSWYADSPYGPERQCNISGQEYNYIAIG